MSNMFAFKVAHPVSVEETDNQPEGQYDVEVQVWQGQDTSVAARCTYRPMIPARKCYNVIRCVTVPAPWYYAATSSKCD